MSFEDFQAKLEEQTRHTVGPYVLLHSIGSGLTAKVKLAIHNETNETFAIKIIKKGSFEEHDDFKMKIQREIALMRLADHPHILKLVDYLESPKHLMIVLEYAAKGELFDYLLDCKVLDVSTAARFFRQIIYAVEYLHCLGICHRDLKPENILLDDQLNIKIADFGFARFLKSNVANTSCGSPHYAAPEVIKGAPYDGKAADVWSCGIILFALLSGYLPFDDQSVRNLLIKVKKGSYQMAPCISEVAADLIRKILVVDPAARITIDQIKSHPFFRMDLPVDYVCPAPLPIRSLDAPIDPGTIPEEIMEILRRIGCTEDQDVANDLAAGGHTTAKVFLLMLTSKVSFLDQLDWSKSGQPANEAIMLEPAQKAYAVKDGNGDPFHRSRQESPEYMSFFSSVTSRPDWVTESASDPPVKEFELHSQGLSVVDTMRLIQILMAEKGWQWFHPDEMSIIARKEATSKYIGAHVVKVTEPYNVFLAFQLYRGSSDDFQDACMAVTELFSGNII